MKQSQFKEKPACAETKKAAPSEAVCPKCGAVNEMWSDETEVKCSSCGQQVVKTP